MQMDILAMIKEEKEYKIFMAIYGKMLAAYDTCLWKFVDD